MDNGYMINKQTIVDNKSLSIIPFVVYIFFYKINKY